MANKTEPIIFRTDPENKAEIETMAKNYGLGVSAYLRMLSKRDYNEYANAKHKLLPAPVVAQETATTEISE